MEKLNRRELLTASAGAVMAMAFRSAEAKDPPKGAPPSRRAVLNFNSNMEYRRLGKTGLWVSAVCLGGHWKRVNKVLRGPFEGCGYCGNDYANVGNPEFLRNRHEVVSRCIEVGINYVDACTSQELLVYSRVLKGRRDKMYIGASWHDREPKKKEWRTAKKLLEGLDLGLKEAGLDYVDLWRITMPSEGLPDLAELASLEENTMEALDRAKRLGKARFTGLSTHNRVWLKSMIEEYPKQLETVCMPYTANSAELPAGSVFAAIKKHDVGVFGIKPFADNSLFKGDSSPNSPHRDDDDQRARLALRYILGNPAITAPIPGLISISQVDNAARAVKEHRHLDARQKAQLESASTEMWANLRPSHQWLRNWQCV
jgi:aryl-alcohol dehydrogenase-like predicted oxidoreductase